LSPWHHCCSGRAGYPGWFRLSRRRRTPCSTRLRAVLANAGRLVRSRSTFPDIGCLGHTRLDLLTVDWYREAWIPCHHSTLGGGCRSRCAASGRSSSSAPRRSRRATEQRRASCGSESANLLKVDSRFTLHSESRESEKAQGHRGSRPENSLMLININEFSVGGVI
jgi:hypothetical protein